MFRRMLGSTSPEDRFWRWFTQNCQALMNSQDFAGPLFAELSKQLELVHPGLVWELGVFGAERELAISADGNRQLFGAVQGLVGVAPRVPGWRVVAFRQRKTLFTFVKGQVRLSPANVRFTMRPGQEGTVDLDLFIEGYRKGDDARAEGVFILLDSALGEYDMETKVGVIKFHAAEEAPPSADARPLSDMAACFDAYFHR